MHIQTNVFNQLTDWGSPMSLSEYHCLNHLQAHYLIRILRGRFLKVQQTPQTTTALEIVEYEIRCTDLQNEKDQKENIVDPFLRLEPTVIERWFLVSKCLWIVLRLTDWLRIRLRISWPRLSIIRIELRISWSLLDSPLILVPISHVLKMRKRVNGSSIITDPWGHGGAESENGLRRSSPRLEPYFCRRFGRTTENSTAAKYCVAT